MDIYFNSAINFKGGLDIVRNNGISFSEIEQSVSKFLTTYYNARRESGPFIFIIFMDYYFKRFWMGSTSTRSGQGPWGYKKSRQL